jgi:hypothetical protein
MIIFDLSEKKYSESLLTGFIRRENMHPSKAMEAKMEKKIAALKAAYAAKNGAKLVTAVATATVPKITVLIGGSFGAGIRLFGIGCCDIGE